MMRGSLRAIRELGVRVPRDLSVISFDDTHWAPFVDPPLTVVAQQAYELGRVAANIVLDAIEDRGQVRRQANTVIRLETRLVRRSSSAAPLSARVERVSAKGR
jgi:LacI family transcriptional regulator